MQFGSSENVWDENSRGQHRGQQAQLHEVSRGLQPAESIVRQEARGVVQSQSRLFIACPECGEKWWDSNVEEETIDSLANY